MGLLCLSAYLKQNLEPPVEISIHDLRLKAEPPETICQHLRLFAPDIVGISALSYEAPAVHQIAALVKGSAEDTPVIIGGPYATSGYDDAVQDRNIDFTVIGEGERTFFELVERYLERRRLTDLFDDSVSGIAFLHQDEILKTKDRDFIADLDTLPYPDYEAIDIPAYSTVPNMNSMLAAEPYMTLCTSRACPFGCIYCHKIFGRKFRAQSPQRVITEIEHLFYTYSVRELHIIDDIFNLDSERAVEICDLIVSRKLQLKLAFPNGLRGDLMTPELLQKLKDAGTYAIAYAVESASPRLQKVMGKNLNLETLRHVIEQTDRLGIITKGFFMFGFPGETREEMQRTVDFALKSPLLMAGFYIVTPQKKTKLYEFYEKSGKLTENNYQQFDYYTIKDKISKQSALARRFVTVAMMRFYLNPYRIFRLLMRFPSKKALFRGFLSFLELLK